MPPKPSQAPETFEAFLDKKKVNAPAFQQAEPQTYADWAARYTRMGMASFSQRYLFLLNEWRLAYPLLNLPGRSLGTPPPAPNEPAA